MDAKLSNPQFMERAKEEAIEEAKERKAELEAEINASRQRCVGWKTRLRCLAGTVARHAEDSWVPGLASGLARDDKKQENPSHPAFGHALPEERRTIA